MYLSQILTEIISNGYFCPCVCFPLIASSHPLFKKEIGYWSWWFTIYMHFKTRLSSSANYSPSMELIFDEVEGFLALISGDLFITFSLANFPIRLVTLRLLLGICFCSISWSLLTAHHKWLVITTVKNSSK